MSHEPGKNGQKRLEILLAEALASGNASDESHFEFEELTRLGEQRLAQGEKWEMPVHLSRCSLCLEAFQVILEGVPETSPRAVERFVELGKERGKSPSNIVPFPSRRNVFLKIAAAIVLLLAAVWAFNLFGGKSSARVNEGVVALQDGRTLPAGAAIPGGIAVTATEPALAGFADGSKVKLTKDTRVSFHESLGGDTTVALSAGEVVATVAKQERGKEFVVKTPLGVVTVVGTRFRVTCHDEEVIVYQSMAGQAESKGRKDTVRAVRVAVFEGIVRVSRRSEQVLLKANQVAVLRESEQGIEVSEEQP